jgi:hypothetical protein
MRAISIGDTPELARSAIAAVAGPTVIAEVNIAPATNEFRYGIVAVKSKSLARMPHLQRRYPTIALIIRNPISRSSFMLTV